ncbi:MAG: hypothetical protein IKW81_05835, partial [Pseudobutyrivibrio sp.]|nr:hypothetical protein [Pseudobutyrivibrio sp.]
MKSTQRPSKINRQIVGLLGVIVFVSLIVVSILTSCFLGDYYIYEKRKDMKELFGIMSEKCEDGTLYGEDYQLDNLSLFESYSVSGLITGADGQSLITSSVDSDILLNQLNYTLLSNDAGNQLIKSTDNYKMYKQKFPETNDTYLVLVGILPDGNFAFIKATAASLEKIASITNRFFLMMVLLDSFISVLIGRYFIAKFTKPLFKLINITKRISNFDFDATYHSQRMYNEMDDLGEHVNEMSTTLKRALEQLRLANENLK